MGSVSVLGITYSEMLMKGQHTLALRGQGIAQFNLPCNQALESGQRVRIQPGYTLQIMSLYAFLLT